MQNNVPQAILYTSCDTHNKSGVKHCDKVTKESRNIKNMTRSEVIELGILKIQIREVEKSKFNFPGCNYFTGINQLLNRMTVFPLRAPGNEGRVYSNLSSLSLSFLIDAHLAE